MRRLWNLVVVAACIALAACSGSEVKGDGKIVTQNRSVDQFSAVEADGNFFVTVNASQSQPALQVKTDENLQPYILTTVKDKKLYVTVKKGFDIVPTTPVQITVATKELASASLNGKTTFVASNLSGQHFELNVNGMANSMLKGTVGSSNINVQGMAEVNASALQAQNVTVDVKGNGRVLVSVARKLKVHIDGVGQVTYTGKPPIIEQEIYGGGKLVKGQ